MLRSTQTVPSASRATGRSAGSRLRRTACRRRRRAGCRRSDSRSAAGRDECALALERADERAQVALEPQLVERRARSAGLVREHRRGRSRSNCSIEGASGSKAIEARHLDAAVGIDAERHLGPSRCSWWRATSRASAAPSANSIPSERARSLGLMPGSPDLDTAEHERRRRQQPRVDCARRRAPAFRPAASPPPRMRAVLAPVDKSGSDQRRHQRQDDRDRQSEQRRLHTSRPGLRTPAAPRRRTAQLADRS